MVVPGQIDQDAVHRIIYRELCLGKIETYSRQTCLNIIKELNQRGAEGIILGCTELPLLIKSDDTKIPLFDTTRLHAEAAVKMALMQ